jgi:penicillin-binding protein 2
LINRINVDVAGKTGTAQEDKTKPSHALFVSYAPFDNPEMSVTTVIPYGYSSGNAEELAGFIYAYLYDKALLENESVTGNTNVSD